MHKIFKFFILLGAIACGQKLLCNKSDQRPTSNKIIYMISPPRSLSVAFMRMMEERGDCEVFNEPSVRAYCRLRFPKMTKTWFHPDSPKTFEQVKQILFTAMQKKNVFAKEMSFSMQRFLQEDVELVENENVHFVFLLRNPHHTILSFYRKNWDMDPNQPYGPVLDYTRYKRVYEIYVDIKKRAKNKVVIVKSEDLCTNTQATVQNFCKSVDIAFLPHSLHWSNLGNDFTGLNEWHEVKSNIVATYFWHRDAINSTGFGSVSKYDTTLLGYPTFNEVTNLEHRQMCFDSYKESLHYYNLLLEEMAK